MKRVIAIALLLAAACSGRSVMPLVDGSTGFHVVATIGPTCPVETPGGDCSDRPYKTELLVLERGSSKIVGRIRTDDAGQTGVSGMDPGDYTVRPAAEDAGPPTAAPVDFTITKGKITEVQMKFDSGIR
jgi:hypothetical protein